MELDNGTRNDECGEAVDEEVRAIILGADSSDLLRWVFDLLVRRDDAVAAGTDSVLLADDEAACRVCVTRVIEWCRAELWRRRTELLAAGRMGL